MKETGIIMSGDHPQLILDLKKTMTRRTYGLGKVNENPDDWVVDFQGNIAAFRNIHTGADVLIRCPYGVVGDRLWVRATWSKNFKGQMLFKYQYHALVKMLDLPNIAILWKPSIHLLKEDAEIWLEITGLSAARVQEISETDAEKEGLNPATYDNPNAYADCPCTNQFIQLWDSLNAKRGLGFDFNPWVWPISFKLIEEGS